MKDLNKNILNDIPKKYQLEKELGEIEDLPDDETKEIKDSLGDPYAQNMKLFILRHQEVKKMSQNY